MHRERLGEQRPTMPLRLGEFQERISGRVVSATFADGVVSMRYVDGEPTESISVSVGDFNGWFLQEVLVPTNPMDR